jgi:hypothetical protein
MAARKLLLIVGLVISAFIVMIALAVAFDPTDTPEMRQHMEDVRNLLAKVDAGPSAPTGLRLGMSWDDALPVLSGADRVNFGFDGENRAIDVRRFPDGRTYRFVFQRDEPGAPLRLVQIANE